MVRDGYFYGLGSIVAAALLGWLTAWPYALPVLLLGAFCLWFFRDPDRHIPQTPGAVVSPADGKVTDVSVVTSGKVSWNRACHLAEVGRYEQQSRLLSPAC